MPKSAYPPRISKNCIYEVNASNTQDSNRRPKQSQTASVRNTHWQVRNGGRCFFVGFANMLVVGKGMQWDCWVCVRASECPVRTGWANPRMFFSFFCTSFWAKCDLKAHMISPLLWQSFLKVLFRKVGLLYASAGVG